MKSKDYMTDTWCLLSGMPRAESANDFMDEAPLPESQPTRHILLRLLLAFLQIVRL